MSKRDKLRRKLRNNPKNVTLQEVKTLLGYFDFVLARIVGSHHVFRHEEFHKNLVVPVHGRRVKPQYVKQALEAIDDLFPEDSSSEDENNE